jgi:hypothetical protein
MLVLHPQAVLTRFLGAPGIGTGRSRASPCRRYGLAARRSAASCPSSSALPIATRSRFDTPRELWRDDKLPAFVTVTSTHLDLVLRIATFLRMKKRPPPLVSAYLIAPAPGSW